MKTGEIVPASMPNTANTTNTSTSTMTTDQALKQLQDAGYIVDMKSAVKPQKQLTPEEQKLQELKIQKQEASLLKKREQKWYTRAKEVLGEYVTDEFCLNFAHDHIYREHLLSHVPDQMMTPRYHQKKMIAC